jgi:hypothetical protein
MAEYDEEVTKGELEAMYRNGNGSLSEDEARNLAYKNGIDWDQWRKDEN